jgi:hypothetical protein
MVHQQQREQDQEDHSRNGVPNGPLLEQHSTYERAKCDKNRTANERIVRNHSDGRDQA